MIRATTVSEIDRAKQSFLTSYNHEESIAVAASRAIRAALQRNPLYLQIGRPGWNERQTLRDEWRRLLEVFPNPQTIEEFEGAIVELRAELLRLFHGVGAARLSHAQKSASVYLKHLWCMRRISEPPVCPIDRRILQKAIGSHQVPLWTPVDTLKEYRAQFAILATAAQRNYQRIAVWELLTFPISDHRGR